MTFFKVPEGAQDSARGPERLEVAELEDVDPIVFSVMAGFIFIFTAVIFWVYDVAVRRRQDKVMANATRTSNIVSNLFPENVRRRMMLSDEQDRKLESSKSNVQTFLAGKKSVYQESSPIADLFPSAVSFYDRRFHLFL